MRALLPSGSVWVSVPDVDGADDLIELIRLEHGEFEVELGAPIEIGAPPKHAPSLLFEIDPEVRVPTLVRSERQVRAIGRSLADATTSLHLLRTMRRLDADELRWEPVDSLSAAAQIVEAEVRTTWPSFERTGHDWAASTASASPVGDLAALQRWVALLGDGHTNVHERADVAALPYSARLVDGRVVLADVPEGTSAHQAGVRAGDELITDDATDVWERAGAPAQARPWLVGRRLLSGPVGELLTLTARRPGRTVRSWTDVPGASTWPEPVEARRLATGTWYLRIRRWSLPDVATIDRVFSELDDGDRLLVDLRGNAGGMLVAAVAFRRRFIAEPTVTGTVRFSTGDGSLSEPTPYVDEPSASRRWLGRTRFLVDGLTYSSSEDAMLGLSQHPQIDIVGQPTGGGSGRARRLPLVGSWELSVSTALTYDHLGRCVEGDGTPVSVAFDDDDMAPDAADRNW